MFNSYSENRLNIVFFRKFRQGWNPERCVAQYFVGAGLTGRGVARPGGSAGPIHDSLRDMVMAMLRAAPTAAIAAVNIADWCTTGMIREVHR